MSWSRELDIGRIAPLFMDQKLIKSPNYPNGSWTVMEIMYIHFMIRGVKYNTNILLWIMCISNNAIWAITTRKNFENFLEFQIFQSTTAPRWEKPHALFSMKKIFSLKFSIISRQKPSVHREKSLCWSDSNLSSPYTSLGKPRWKYVVFFPLASVQDKYGAITPSSHLHGRCPLVKWVEQQ